MKNTVLSATFCLTAGVAFAGGMGPVNEEANWAGVYAGVNSGFYVDNAKTNYDYSYVPGGSFSELFGNAADNASTTAADGPLNVGGLNAVQSAQVHGIIPVKLGSTTTTGFAGGLQLGYNWQNTVWVYGVEADFEWFSTGPQFGFSGFAVGEIAPGDTVTYANAGHTQITINWLSTERLRLGYAYGAFLPYITGGFAFGNAFSKTFSNGTDLSQVSVYSNSYSNVRPGWTAGGGVECLLATHWTARVEALYYDLGTPTYNVTPRTEAAVGSELAARASHHFDGTLVRLGVNYLF